MDPCEYFGYKKGIRPDNRHIKYPACRLKIYEGEFGSHEQECSHKGDKTKCPLFVDIKTSISL